MEPYRPRNRLIRLRVAQTADYHLYRATSPSDEPRCLTTGLIPAQGSGGQGADYEWRDTTVEPGTTYYYWLEDVATDGTPTRHGPYAIIGTSRPRENRTFAGLALDDNLKAHDAEARCALYVIDIRTGDTVHWLRMDGMGGELYDVVALPGVRRPMALGLKTDEIHRFLTIEGR